MISIRLAQKSDQAKWDDYVTSHPDAWPYHLFAWKLAIEHVYRHNAHYLIAEGKQKVVGVLPLIHLYFPCLVNEIISLPYCDVGNCLYDNQNVFEKLINAAVELGEKLKVNKISLRGQISNISHGQGRLVGEQIDKVRMILSLPASSEDLMASFKSKLRSQICKAKKNKLIFRWGNINSIAEYYDVFSKNMHDLGSPVHERKLFYSILKYYGENARLGLVELNGKTIGGGIILSVGKKVSIPWASTLREYNHLAPNMHLYWNVLKYSCDNGFNVFDFGRSTQGEGTYKFKSQWGAQPTPLEWHSIYFNKKKMKDGFERSNRREMLENVWQKIPVPLANFVGPMIRKYISL